MRARSSRSAAGSLPGSGSRSAARLWSQARALPLALCALAPGPATADFSLPRTSSQCIVGIAGDWNSSRAQLQRYRRDGGKWKPEGNPWPARLGKQGLVWGSGLHPVPQNATRKQEGDGRAPAGVFSLGGVWGYAPRMELHPALPYRQVTPRDLWVEDPRSPLYNRHVVLPRPPASEWERKQQMKQQDPAHSLKLFIAHNAAPSTVPGAGSSIFFHIWRQDGGKPSAGCTTMAEAELRRMISWIDPTRKPLYVLLPRAEYGRFRKAWKLP
jgi:L,D-peptidoglycan transpeptidase YkuD (ErfK/YbiS/YcfS/YnhG family)